MHRLRSHRVQCASLTEEHLEGVLQILKDAGQKNCSFGEKLNRASSLIGSLKDVHDSFDFITTQTAYICHITCFHPH